MKNKVNRTVCSKWTVMFTIIIILIFLHYHKSIVFILNTNVSWENWKQCHQKPPLYPTFAPNQLYNLTNFEFLRNNESTCDISDSKSKLVVILIHSSRQNTFFRNVIRETWGSVEKPLDGWTRRLVFFTGVYDSKRNLSESEVEREETTLDQEYIAFGDLVTGNFIDSYRNLTYKHLMAYKWTLTFCQRAEFVFKADDDFYLDLKAVLQLREKELRDRSLNPVANLWCVKLDSEDANRNKETKWFLTREEYPEEKYPPYCYGVVYAITMDLLYKVYSVHQKSRFLWIDDVFVLGIAQQVALKEYNGTLRIIKRNLWEENIYSTELYSEFCKAKKWNGTRPLFGVTVIVNRNNEYERNLRCIFRLIQMENGGARVNKSIDFEY